MARQGNRGRAKGKQSEKQNPARRQQNKPDQKQPGNKAPKESVSAAVAGTGSDNQVRTSEQQQPAENALRRQWPKPFGLCKRSYAAINWKAVDAIATLACTIVIAYFAYGQVYYGNRQWASMELQNGIMKEQIKQTDKTLKEMQLDRRSWLGFVRPTISPLKAGPKIKCAVSVENSGKVPGMTIRMGFSTRFIKPNDTSAIEKFSSEVVAATLQLPDARQIVLAPGAATTVPITGEAPTPEQVSAIEKGELTVFAAGCFVYSDSVTELGFTRAMLVREPSVDRAGEYDLRIYQKYNEMK